MIIDTHAHLDMDQYDADRDEVIERARQNGVDYILNIGCDVESSARSLELAEQYDFIYATAGIHPHDVKSIDGNHLRRPETVTRSSQDGGSGGNRSRLFQKLLSPGISNERTLEENNWNWPKNSISPSSFIVGMPTKT